MSFSSRSYYVVGGKDSGVCRVFDGCGMKLTGFKDADVVVFTGGGDIDASRYGEKNHQSNYPSVHRDELEFDVYWEAVTQGKMIAGICRGGQLIHVANGGKMWQNVDGHRTGRHWALDIPSGQVHQVTTCHHQMMRVDDIHAKENTFEIVAIAECSSVRETLGLTYRASEKEKKFRNDIEVLWFPFVQSLAYQGHPEFGLATCTKYFYELLVRYGFHQGTSSGTPPTFLTETWEDELNKDIAKIQQVG